jgi:hypothetical protein
MYGVQIENCSDVGGGQDVGFTDPGDWMDYDVNVQSAGLYVFTYRVASGNGGARFQLQRGQGVYNTVDVPNTGGWQTWTTDTLTASLTAGLQTFRIAVLKGGFNINWFKASKCSLTANAGPDITINKGQSATLTTTGGISYLWSPSTGLNKNNSATVIANPTQTTAYVLTVSDGTGCFATDTVIVTVSSATGIISQYLSTSITIYPNPTNQSAIISYFLSENSTIQISVYDVLGREVMQLVNENQSSGKHWKNINTEQLQNGIYFVKMNINGQQLTQKLIINK